MGRDKGDHPRHRSSRSDSRSKSTSRRALRSRSRSAPSRSRSRGRCGTYGGDRHRSERRRRYSSSRSTSIERSEIRSAQRRDQNSRSNSNSRATRNETIRSHHDREIDPFGRDRPVHELRGYSPGSPETSRLRDVALASLRRDRDGGCSAEDVVDQTTTAEDVIANMVVKRIKLIIDAEVKAYVDSSEFRALVEALRRRERERVLEAVQTEVRAGLSTRACSECITRLLGCDGMPVVGAGGAALGFEGSAECAGPRQVEAVTCTRGGPSVAPLPIEESAASVVTEQRVLEERLKEVQKKHEEETRRLREEEQQRAAQRLAQSEILKRPEKLSFGIKKRTTMW